MSLIRRLAALLLIAICISLQATPSATATEWYSTNSNNQPVVNLYFFWSEKCPHCLRARPDIIELDKKYDWLVLHSHELSTSPANVSKFTNMAGEFNENINSVPTFMFCGNAFSGYESREVTGKKLERYLLECYQFVLVNKPDSSETYIIDENSLASLTLPVIGDISASEYSLPVLTLFIAGMDAFNPCAFFVLLFLLSMMVHGHSRSRLAMIGGIFIFFSGAIYFLFMAAWLNLFLYIGELRLITLIAGLFAITIATINIKDYFYFGRGLSLHIPDEARPRLFDRVRMLLHLESKITMIFATILLAIVANSYELLCTAGFPMVYTRILTLQSLTTESYYLYLLMYNLVYITPLLLIVVLFTIKLDSRKLTEKEGVTLKLLSGIMMLMLGLVLVIEPQLLNNLLTAASLVLIALLTTWGVVKFSKQKY